MKNINIFIPQNAQEPLDLDSLDNFDYAILLPNQLQNEKPNEFQNIWRAVITQALQDACCTSQKLENRRIRAQAIAWLNGNCEDFLQVCENANIEPSLVKKHVGIIVKKTSGLYKSFMRKKSKKNKYGKVGRPTKDVTSLNLRAKI